MPADFAGIIGSAGRGGSITAIALGIPGTAQNAATVLDGYPMSKRGETSRALGIAASTAMLGATFGLVTLLLFIPVFVPFLMSFGPAERFWIMAFGLVAMSVALPTNFLADSAAVSIGNHSRRCRIWRPDHRRRRAHAPAPITPTVSIWWPGSSACS